MKVEQITYKINWKMFKAGYSFFIPCLDPQKSRRNILDAVHRLKYKVVTKVVIENGVRGIRVWRV
jgi:hypothetical protein